MVSAAFYNIFSGSWSNVERIHYLKFLFEETSAELTRESNWSATCAVTESLGREVRESRYFSLSRARVARRTESKSQFLCASATLYTRYAARCCHTSFARDQPDLLFLLFFSFLHFSLLSRKHSSFSVDAMDAMLFHRCRVCTVIHLTSFRYTPIGKFV